MIPLRISPPLKEALRREPPMAATWRTGFAAAISLSLGGRVKSDIYRQREREREFNFLEDWPAN